MKKNYFNQPERRSIKRKYDLEGPTVENIPSVQRLWNAILEWVEGMFGRFRSWLGYLPGVKLRERGPLAKISHSRNPDRDNPDLARQRRSYLRRSRKQRK